MDKEYGMNKMNRMEEMHPKEKKYENDAPP